MHGSPCGCLCMCVCVCVCTRASRGVAGSSNLVCSSVIF